MQSDRRDVVMALGLPVVFVLVVAGLLRPRASSASEQAPPRVDDRLPVAPPQWHRAAGLDTATPRRGAAAATRATTGPRAAAGRAGEPGDARAGGTEPAAGDPDTGLVGEAFGTIELAGYGDDGEEYAYTTAPRAYSRRTVYRRGGAWYSRWRRATQPAYWFLQPSGGTPSVAGAALPWSPADVPALGNGPAAVARAGAGATSATAAPARLERASDGRWRLWNALTEVLVDPAALCALRVRGVARRAAESPDLLRFVTPDAEAGCVVAPHNLGGDEDAARDADPGARAAVTVTWRGADWVQRAEVSLAAGAEAPEAVVRLVRAAATPPGAARAVLYVANLTERALPLRATGNGEDATVAPGCVARVLLPDDGDGDAS